MNETIHCLTPNLNGSQVILINFEKQPLKFTDCGWNFDLIHLDLSLNEPKIVRFITGFTANVKGVIISVDNFEFTFERHFYFYRNTTARHS